MYKAAITGQIVWATYEDLKDDFPSEADLQAWCTTNNLQYIYLPQTQQYKIFKIQ